MWMRDEPEQRIIMNIIGRLAWIRLDSFEHFFVCLIEVNETKKEMSDQNKHKYQIWLFMYIFNTSGKRIKYFFHWFYLNRHGLRCVMSIKINIWTEVKSFCDYPANFATIIFGYENDFILNSQNHTICFENVCYFSHFSQINFALTVWMWK